MKQIVIFLSLLLTMGLFSGCSNDDDKYDHELSSIQPTNDDIPLFFNSVFESEGENVIDFKNNISDTTSPCIIVNSKEDFEKSYTGKMLLPEIDFSKYTLVLGKVCLSAGIFIDSIGIKQLNSAKAILTVNCSIDDGTYYGIMRNLCYWGLFQKFHASEMSVKVNSKEE